MTAHLIPPVDTSLLAPSPDRLATALAGLPKGAAGPADIAVLMRQRIRTRHERQPLPRAVWEQCANRSGLRADASDAPDTVLVRDDPWHPAWLPQTQLTDIDALARRCNDPPAVGDGVLYAATGFPTYQSAAQQAAIGACLFAPPGATTLVTLPTGAGKSLCAHLPAWYDANQGGGTTLVVVPTIALALDQEAQFRQRFRDERGTWVDLPLCHIGSTPIEKRDRIHAALHNGTLPVLFTSPESLLQSNLYDVCLQAASTGRIARLVLDEAHLVATWGAGFRTDFQFLAAYRRKLLDATGGRLRTVLLSATISEQTDRLLRHLFGRSGAVWSVNANRLRPEPSYWFAQCANESTRRERVREALAHLPRPAILYVTRPDDAEEWAAELRAVGYVRLGTFTGDTPAAERQRRIAAWRDGEIDLMIATSAFGLGVDKGDVRAIVHACLPENVDRFYQEVGRGGRDGMSMVSLVCVAPNDYAAAESFITSAVVTSETAVGRWKGMRSSATQTGGQCLDIDLDAPPANLRGSFTGERNRQWNEHVLLLMQRGNLVRIEETAVLPADTGNDGDSRDDRRPRIRLTLLQPDITNDDQQLRKRLEYQREAEREVLTHSLHRLRDLVQKGASNTLEECIALTFAELYPDSALACGGCPACRMQGIAPYTDSLRFAVDVPTATPEQAYLIADVTRLFGVGRALRLYRSVGVSPDAHERIAAFLARAVACGFQQLIVPDALYRDNGWSYALVAALAAHATVLHRVIAAGTVTANDAALFAVPTLAVYPDNDTAADALYLALVNSLPLGTLRAHVYGAALTSRSLGGSFQEKAEGILLSLDAFDAELAVHIAAQTALF